MNNYNHFQENLETQSTLQSINSGLRVMDPVQVQGKPVFPWAPTTTIQKVGASLVKDKSLIDIDSELMNLTRKNSNDPNKHYKPDEKKLINYNHLKDGFFHSDSTLLTNPPSTLRGQTTNRWYELHKPIQVNSLEPFDFREGYNTHLMLVDTYEECDIDVLNSIE
tara:strand:- start:1933 stop:2427 length:495 start_codon:yes stop_codon:yes gene_type:complete